MAGGKAPRHRIDRGNQFTRHGRPQARGPGQSGTRPGDFGSAQRRRGEKLFDAKHATFVEFARALREAGTQMLTAVDKKDPTGMMNAGAAMDGVCEGCHLTFWYPNQVIPPLPADFGVKGHAASEADSIESRMSRQLSPWQSHASSTFNWPCPPAARLWPGLSTRASWG